MNTYVLGFQDIDKTKFALVGGKGANLGELFKINRIRVPEGFCITTEAYKKTIEQTPELPGLLKQLSCVKAEDRKSIGEISAKIRRAIEETTIPKEIGSIRTWKSGWAKRARQIHSSKLLPTTLPPKWDWICWMWWMSSGNIRR